MLFRSEDLLLSVLPRDYEGDVLMPSLPDSFRFDQSWQMNGFVVRRWVNEWFRRRG